MGLVRFGDDRRTDEVIARLLEDGEAYFGGTTWRGRRAMRVSVCNWQTTEEDVERVVEAVRRAPGLLMLLWRNPAPRRRPRLTVIIPASKRVIMKGTVA